MVYRYLTTEVGIPVLDRILSRRAQIRIADFPSLQLQLVNHQLRSEYKEEMARSSQQELRVWTERFSIPLTTSSYRNVHMRLGLCRIKHMWLTFAGDTDLTDPTGSRYSHYDQQ